MDIQTLGAALALTKSQSAKAAEEAAKNVLPKTTKGDAGEVMIVGADGNWTKGTTTGASITVSGTTLTIKKGDE